MIEEHVVDLIPAYALEALDPAESAVVEAHLSGCAACRAELEAYRRVAEALPLGMKAYQPPARLRASILRAVEPAPAAPRRAWRLTLQPAWAIAGLVLILALVVSNVLLWRQVRGQQNAFSTVALAGTGAAPGASGLMVISPDGKYGALIADHLPELPAGKAYQLWLIRDGQRTSGGVVSAVRNGYAVMRVYSKDPLNEFTSFGVTVEPEGGSPGPTGEKVLGG